jgi:hypothetical protein
MNLVGNLKMKEGFSNIVLMIAFFYSVLQYSLNASTILGSDRGGFDLWNAISCVAWYSGSKLVK